MLSACLDVPSNPNMEPKIENISVILVHENSIDSTLFKITPNETAKIKAVVTPKEYENKLHFFWYQNKFENNNVVQSLVSEKKSFDINPSKKPEKIPNALWVEDDEGNHLVKVFNIFVNSPPKLDKDVYPAKGDTLYGDINTAFQFKWNSSDKDKEPISHTIIIDKESFELGSLTSIRQSGFTPGKHFYKIIAIDSFGDMDSTKTTVFYVLSSQKEK